MNDQRAGVAVEHVQFGSVFQFGSILKAIGTAMSPSRIGIAMFTLALLVGGGRIWDAVASAEGQEAAVIERPFGAMTASVEHAAVGLGEGLWTLSPTAIVESAKAILWDTPAALWQAGHHWFIILFGLWTAAVLAFGGGLLCRLEAVTIASDDMPRLDPALGMVLSRWGAFFSALLVPFVLIALLAIFLLFFGLVLLNLPLFNLLGGVLYGIALLFGLGIAVMLLGYGVAGVLLLPAVAAENCDGADAIHRALAFVVARPLSWMLYLATIFVGLGMGLLLVGTVAELTLSLTRSLVESWTFNETMPIVDAMYAGVEPPDTNWPWHMGWTAGLISFWSGLVAWAVAGWSFAYMMSASTRAYLLLRLAADGQPEGEIWWPGLIRGTLAPEPPADSPAE